MSKMPRQSYTGEFKREAVRLVEDGMNPAEVARQLGISKKTLGNWRKAKATGKLASSGKVVTLGQMGLSQLRVEVIRLNAENAILKKAAAHSAHNLAALMQHYLSASTQGEDENSSLKEEILTLYMLSAENGYAGAQNNLGDMYELGQGVHKNDKAAVHWYTRSAERGEPTAYFSLATILSDSTEESVLIEALKFAILAVNQLPDGVNKAAADQTIKKINPKLSVTARDKAKTLAEAWEPLYQEKYLMGDTLIK